MDAMVERPGCHFVSGPPGQVPIRERQTGKVVVSVLSMIGEANAG